MQETAERYREALIEAVAETDEDLLNTYLSTRLALGGQRSAVACAWEPFSTTIVPVLCGSGLRNKGIQPLLDAVIDYLPAPLDLPPVTGINPKTGEQVTRASDPAAPFAALAFKISMDQGRKLTYFRIYSGKVAAGATSLRRQSRCAGAYRSPLPHACQQARAHR